MDNHTCYTNINGRLINAGEAAVPADNKAFRYGQGLFETMLFRDGQIMLWQYHHERLFGGLALLGFNVPPLFTPQYIEEEISKTVRRNKLEQLCRVRLQVYAGSGGLFEHTSPKPEFIIECFPLDAHTLLLNESGLHIGIAGGLRKSNDSLANLKSCNALIYAIAAQQAKANKWNDALLLNDSGNIVESSIANIFIISNNEIYTPPLSEGCVAGVMRSYIIERLQQSGITIQQAVLTTEMLLEADAIFLTNAIKRLRWVENFDNRTYRISGIKAFSDKILSFH